MDTYKIGQIVIEALANEGYSIVPMERERIYTREEIIEEKEMVRRHQEMEFD